MIPLYVLFRRMSKTLRRQWPAGGASKKQILLGGSFTAFRRGAAFRRSVAGSSTVRSSLAGAGAVRRSAFGSSTLGSSALGSGIIRPGDGFICICGITGDIAVRNGGSLAGGSSLRGGCTRSAAFRGSGGGNAGAYGRGNGRADRAGTAGSVLIVSTSRKRNGKSGSQYNQNVLFHVFCLLPNGKHLLSLRYDNQEDRHNMPNPHLRNYFSAIDYSISSLCNLKMKIY